MAKAPLPGEVKTRLSPPLTPGEAAELYKCLLLDLLKNFATYSNADLFLAFAPLREVSVFRELVPPLFTLFPQEGKDLGERMLNTFSTLFQRGYRKVVLVGSDLPGLPLEFAEMAFRRLDDIGYDLVLGPTSDGGYYLIGLRSPIKEIFQDVNWGEPTVLSSTMEKLSRLHLKPFMISQWHDIDTPDDLVNFTSLNYIPETLHQKIVSFLKSGRRDRI